MSDSKSDDLDPGAKITKKQSEQIGLHGIACYQDLLDMIAFDALKRARLEVQACRPYAQKHHRTLALWTDGIIDCS
jgi:hypothetical protein